MLDFVTVCREFRALVERRRDIITFLGTAFAAMSLFLENVFEGKLPASLSGIQEHVFAFYALVLMVISLILAMRLARLHGGMVLNGILYAKLMQKQTFTRQGDTVKATKHNHFGVSYIQFLMVNLIASFSTFILALSLNLPFSGCLLAGASVFALWLIFYFRTRSSAIAFAMKKIETDECGLVPENEWREHISQSLHQSNQGLLGELAFAGLMVFSCFGAISGMGKIDGSNLDLGKEMVTRYGPPLYAGLMLITCILESLLYLRLRLAIGQFSLLLDPSDKPFRVFRITDSFLGYLLMAFLTCISLHVFLNTINVVRNAGTNTILSIDIAVFLLLVLAEKVALSIAAKR